MQLQELARSNLMKTLCEALRHMDQESLVARVAKHLQLPLAAMESQQTATSLHAGPSLRVCVPQSNGLQPLLTHPSSSIPDSTSTWHPKGRRSQRSSRPSSAAAAVTGMQTRSKPKGYPARASSDDEVSHSCCTVQRPKLCCMWLQNFVMACLQAHIALVLSKTLTNALQGKMSCASGASTFCCFQYCHTLRQAQQAQGHTNPPLPI